MKRLFILILINIFNFAFSLGFSQNQRLAILPSSMQGDGLYLTSICIDIFRDSPLDQQYKLIGSSREAFDVIDYQTVRRSSNQTAGFSMPKIIGEYNETVPTYYRRFINETVERYNQGTAITYDQLDELQNEIWVFNGLDYFRFINREAADIHKSYESGRAMFIEEFGLDDVNSSIVDKLHKLQILKSIPRSSMSDLSFSNRQVRFTNQGSIKNLSVSYTEGLKGSLSAQEVTAGVRRYNHFYRIPPEQASAEPGAPGKALLTLSDDEYEKILYVNVSLNNGLGFIRELEKMGIKVDNRLLAKIKKENE